ncbi:DUF416 family protein [Pseudomonas sp. CGJS7]|uniref:DUF416 family protein n=1 Tax=Pseudomonas sp. CGJS7 TaxID=3109348 RepID=UPI003008CFC3
MFQFDLLTTELNKMSSIRRSLFAVMTAERLTPFFRHHAGANLAAVEVVNKALNFVWRGISHPAPSSNENTQGVEQINFVQRVIPDEDDPAHFSAQADDAAAALIYAIRSLSSQDPRDAAWAAQRAYDSVDNFINRLPDSTGFIPSTYVDNHPLLDEELSVQKADLEYAWQANLEDLPSARRRSVQAGEVFFSRLIKTMDGDG